MKIENLLVGVFGDEKAACEMHETVRALRRRLPCQEPRSGRGGDRAMIPGWDHGFTDQGVSLMVSVSMETAAQTEQRLRRVIAQADLVVHDGVWCFEESPVDQPPTLTGETLAVVGDRESWSRLVPLTQEGDGVERFGIFSFHFADHVDNSGFVGWLATHLKVELGTGVFVVCGSNRTRGGIYDYWGCPIDLLDQALAVVRTLRAS